MIRVIQVIRWGVGEVPPNGCRWCGEPHGNHGLQWNTWRGMHGWVQPTDAQIFARMQARRTAKLTASNLPFDPVATAQALRRRARRARHRRGGAR